MRAVRSASSTRRLRGCGHRMVMEASTVQGPLLFSRPVKRSRQKAMHGLNDQIFRGGREPRRVPVIDHREIGLVTPLAQDPPRGNVAGYVIAVRRDPEPLGVDFPLEPQCVVDDNFAGEKDHGHVVAETPRLHDVGHGRWE